MEATMTREQQVRYWRENLACSLVLLAIWFACSFLAGIVFADRLDRIRLGGFPLGFWFANQGSILTFVLLIVAYVALTNRLDRKYGVFER
jgi:putative solute:sodium symporter small subunit